MRVVRCPFADGPVFHPGSNSVGNIFFDFFATVDGCQKFFVNIIRQYLLHHRLAEDVGAEIVTDPYTRYVDGHRRPRVH